MSKCVALYLRVSLSDYMADESNSIVNQRSLLRKYLENHSEFKDAAVLEFKDDGYSGTTFNRPGLEEMLQLVKQRKIQVIIVKDLSRFGRNHIEVDTYLEQIFPFLGVRFIAVNDEVDSNKLIKTGIFGEDVIFRNIINEYYSREHSEKMKSCIRQKRNQGKYMCLIPPYGYLRGENDVFQVDPETAPIVQKIFHWYLKENLTCIEIARMLNRDGIISPGGNRKKIYKTGVYYTAKNPIWSNAAVKRILKTNTYRGVILLKEKDDSGNIVSKEIKTINIPEIISGELFLAVQEKIISTQKPHSTPEKQRHYPLKGKLFCGNCLRTLNVFPHTDYRKCRSAMMGADEKCVGYKMPDKEINEIILNSIKKFASLVDEQQINLKREQEELNTIITNLKHDIHKKEKILSKSDLQKSQVYVSFMMNKISEKKYREKWDKIDYNDKVLNQEIKEQKEKLENAKIRLERLCQTSNMNLYSLVKDEEELTEEIVNIFIDKIFAYPDKRLEIKWKFSNILVENIEKKIFVTLT